MSERITLVVPDGTKLKLKTLADDQKRKSGNLGMKYLLEGIMKDSIRKNYHESENSKL